MIRPEIGLSDISFDLSVETGSSYKGSFFVYSKNNIELSGKVLSTNDKVVVEEAELTGNTCEVVYHFHGEMSIPGEEHYGEFLLLTNGGEKNIPYCVFVVPKIYRYGNVELKNLEDFLILSEKDWELAREIFFTKDFPEILLCEQDELRNLYHDLLKGYSKDAIMDHFLMAAMGKEPVKIKSDKNTVRIDETKVGRFQVEKEGWGCADGRIYSRHGNVYLNLERFSQDDFKEGPLSVFLSFKDGFEKDEVIVETAFCSITIPVMKKADASQEAPLPDKNYSALLRSYIDYRVGRISVSEYIESSLKRYPLKGDFYELYCFLLLLIRNQTEALSREMEEDFLSYAHFMEEKDYEKDSEYGNFYRYVMALWKKEEAYTKETAAHIRRSFEKDGKLNDYLLLLLVDEKLAFSYKEQWKTLAGFLEQGENSPFLYLALLDVLNEEPYLLEQLDENKTMVIGWGFRHQYVSKKLMEQFARLSMGEKQFRENQLPILKSMYHKLDEDLFLKAICSMLMKGNQIEKENHMYFESALNKKMNFIGINEFYLRTIDFDTYPVLPKSVLYYFLYSNSLDKREKAWLYVNILLHKEEYEESYESYRDRILDFVKEQFMDGKMNRHLKELYNRLLPGLLEEHELAKHVPNIIFRKRITCHNPVMEGIYVCHAQTEEEVYVPFVHGICQADIYSDQYCLYLADRMGNRYITGVAYTVESYMQEEDYKEYCLTYIKDNRKVYTRWLYMDESDKKEQLARLIVQNDETKSWKREKAVEQILDYHYDEKMLEDLNECLDKINYRVISPAYRRTLMNYYMACNRMEDAYFGVELYGSDMMDPAQLYLLACVGLYLHKDQKDELLLILAHRSFMNRRYNKEILIYLREYYEGRVFDLLDLWTVLKKEGLHNKEYERKVLLQILFTNKEDDRVLNLLSSYLEEYEDEEITGKILDSYGYRYLPNTLRKKKEGKIPELYFEIVKERMKKEHSVSDMSCLSYLLRKSIHGYEPAEQPMIKKQVSRFCRNQVVFPFFGAFDEFVSMPGLFKESTCFFLLDEPGQQIDVMVKIDTEFDLWLEKIHTREIGEGFYYGMVFGAADGIACSFDSPERENLCTSSPYSGAGKPSSAVMPDEEEKETCGSWMKDYGMILSRMDGKLSYLGERDV